MQTETALVPAQGRPRQGQRFALDQPPFDQPPFMTNNWRRLLGLFDEGDPANGKLRDVMVFGRVATIWHKDVIIRTPLGIPDGFYGLDSEDGLVYRGPCEKDLPSVVPPTIARSENIPQGDIRQLATWALSVYDECPNPEAARIVIEQDRFIAEHDVRNYFQIRSTRNIRLAMTFPIGGEPLFVHPTHLMVAAIECTRYDTVVIAHDSRLDALTPVIIGRDPAQCVIVGTKPPFIRHHRPNG